MMKTLIIIPAYNEQENIVRAIESLDGIPGDILVVNDCSTDDTGRLAAATGRAVVVDLPGNLGIGGAVQTGFIYARDRGYDCALQFDGDGQHKAGEVPGLIAPIRSGEADVVVGSRFAEKHRGYRSTASRRMGIKFFQWLNHMITGQRITDNTSGFRAYNRDAIALLADNYPSDYPEPEAISILGRNGFRIKEVFAGMQERQGGVSSIRGLRSPYYMIKVSLSILLSGMRPVVRKNDEMNENSST